MRSLPLTRPFALALASALALAACAGQIASYTRFRRASETGRTVASSEIRVADFGIERFSALILEHTARGGIAAVATHLQMPFTAVRELKLGGSA